MQSVGPTHPGEGDPAERCLRRNRFFHPRKLPVGTLSNRHGTVGSPFREAGALFARMKAAVSLFETVMDLLSVAVFYF